MTMGITVLSNLHTKLILVRIWINFGAFGMWIRVGHGRTETQADLHTKCTLIEQFLEDFVR